MSAQIPLEVYIQIWYNGGRKKVPMAKKDFRDQLVTDITDIAKDYGLTEDEQFPAFAKELADEVAIGVEDIIRQALEGMNDEPNK